MATNFLSGPIIRAGESLSEPMDCSGYALVRIITPSDWDTAPLTFQVSPDGVAYNDLFHVQNVPGPYTAFEVTVPRLEPSASFAVPSGLGRGVNFVRFRSGTRIQPVVQKAARTFTMVFDPGLTVAGPTGPAGAAGAAGSPGPTGPTGTYTKGTILADEAPAGMIGEVISSSNFGGVALTTAVPMNVTQITLSPGDWNIGGVVIFTPVSTGPNSVIAALGQTAAALPSDNDVATGKAIMQQIWASSMPAGKTQTTPTSLIRVNTNATKPVYLVAMATFGGGTVTATGYISARRIR